MKPKQPNATVESDHDHEEKLPVGAQNFDFGTGSVHDKKNKIQ